MLVATNFNQSAVYPSLSWAWPSSALACFGYFHSYAPQKSSKMDDYWIIMEYFENKYQNSQFWERNNSYVSSDSDLSSGFRVWLLITVKMGHPVYHIDAAYYTPQIQCESTKK